MATGGSDKSTKLCYYYNTPAGCWREERCSFIHVRDETADTRPICRFFGTPKRCWYGKDCFFRHVKPGARSQEGVRVNSTRGQRAPKPARKKNVPDTNNNEKVAVSVSEVDQELGTEDDQLESMKGEGEARALGSQEADKTGQDVEAGHDNTEHEISATCDCTELEIKAACDTEAGDQMAQAGSVDDDVDDVDSKCDECRAKEVHHNGQEDLDESPEQAKVTRQDLTCGECGEFFKDGEGEVSAYTALEKHYFTMLGKADKEHMKIFHETDGFLKDKALCGACGRIFRRPDDLLRHLGSKYMAKSEKHSHKEYFSEIVHQFVDRDAGLASDDEGEMVDFLMIFMREHYVSEQDTDTDDSDVCECHDPPGMSAYITHQLRRLSKLSKSELDEDCDERAENYGGFTNDEMEELLCQGIKPWDDEAYGALAVINGFDSYGFDSDY